jgi:hypothetical protein
MRSVRITLGLAASMLVLGVSAVPAMASGEFMASKVTAGGSAPFPLKLKGAGVGPQEFVFKKIHIVCPTAKVSGTIPSATSKTIALVVSYKGCETGPISVWGHPTYEVPMKFKEKAELTYHFNGYVESEEEIEMQAKYVKCIVDWDEGTIPEKAEEKPEKEYFASTYTAEEFPTEDMKRFPSGFQHKLLITNAFKGMEWEEEGGGVCEDADIELTEGESGKYNGKLMVEVPNGNIEV